MSRLDGRQLDELVQATVELQNRPREERRMRTVAFTAHVDERELAGLDSATRVEIIEARWQHLNHQMATYIAENLSANQYQLLRAVREQGRNPIYRQGVVTMTLTLEVGRVTERPFVNVATPNPAPLNGNRGERATVSQERVYDLGLPEDIQIDGDVLDLRAIRDMERARSAEQSNADVAAQGIPPWIEENASPGDGINTNPLPPNFRNWTGSYATIPREQMEAAARNGAFNGGLPSQPTLAERELTIVRGGRSRIAEELGIDFGPTETPPAPKPDPVPHKRHILIDRKDKQ